MAKKSKKLPLVVVEQHQHALEHIHYMLRKDKRLLSSLSWTLVHFDAHPDMACSLDAPANLCFKPRGSGDKTLYDHLDETSTGIAEWILPLVLAAKLHYIVWVKPTFSRQLELGETDFQVGILSKRKVETFLDLEENDLMRVDYHHPYYLDDDVVVETNDLQLEQTLHLHVKHAVGDDTTMHTTAAAALVLDNPWMLDICLDYFVCRNPFVHDLEVIHKEYTTLVAKLSEEGLEIAKTSQDYRAKRTTFHKAFEMLLTRKDQGQELCHYFSSEEDNTVVNDLREILDTAENAEQLASMTIEALPHMASMPHESEIPSFSPIIEQRIQAVMEEIQLYSTTSPFLVTIARSANDGFCPLSLVEEIQENLLQRLHHHYCGAECDDEICCKLRVVKDYGEWEGSTLD